MASFPDDLFSFREIENVSTAEYDETKKTRFFVEDFLALVNEIIAIEEILGLNVNGDFDTVNERLIGFPDIFYISWGTRRVGIGTNTPTSQFHLVNDTNVVGGLLCDFDTFEDTTNYKSTMRVRRARGTKASPTKVLSGNQLGTFGFVGAFDSGGVGVFPTGSQASLFAKAEEDFNDNSHMGAYFTFETTAPASGSRTEKVRITGDGRVWIGTTAGNANAILDLVSTTKPFLPPRMTTTQRDAVSSPTAGMVIYNSTTNVLNFYNGSAWGAV